MKSRRGTIYTVGWDGVLFHYEDIVCPDNMEIIKGGFLNFFVRYLADWNHEFCLFLAPTTVGQEPLGNENKIMYIQTQGVDTVKFRADKILARFYPQFTNVFEIFDEKEIKFEEYLSPL